MLWLLNGSASPIQVERPTEMAVGISLSAGNRTGNDRRAPASCRGSIYGTLRVVQITGPCICGRRALQM